MRKLILKVLSVVAILASANAYAQLPANSVATDFTLTDINGNSFHLYDVLDQGKSVLIDFSATWCGPCWNYHSTHKLREVYDAYGPSGTDELTVLYIEGDVATTLADLQGTGSSTQGDWVTGTTYPIFNPTVSTVMTAYQIAYFPTLYIICPNRLVNEFSQSLDTAQIHALATACPVATTTNDPAILTYEGQTSSCGSFNLKVLLQNNGLDPLTACTITATDAASNVLVTFPWTGNLATYATQLVDLGNVNIAASTTVTIAITSTDNNSANNSVSTSLSMASVATSNTVVLELKTDNYGDETSWKLFNGSNSILYQSTGTYGNNTVYTSTFNVPNVDCYKFEIYDAYGDGMCCAYGNGYYKLTSNTTILGQGGQYMASDVRNFEVDATTGLNDNLANISGVSLYPNPANGNTKLNFNLSVASDVTIEIVNTLGQTVRTINLGNTSSGTIETGINVSDLNSGIYFLTLKAGSTSWQQKFTVAH
jgi:cytochrome oxidase Cu insertion factor (SCO1/SenC/PrrC family)